MSYKVSGATPSPQFLFLAPHKLIMVMHTYNAVTGAGVSPATEDLKLGKTLSKTTHTYTSNPSCSEFACFFQVSMYHHSLNDKTYRQTPLLPVLVPPPPPLWPQTVSQC